MIRRVVYPRGFARGLPYTAARVLLAPGLALHEILTCALLAVALTPEGMPGKVPAVILQEDMLSFNPP